VLTAAATLAYVWVWAPIVAVEWAPQFVGASGWQPLRIAGPVTRIVPSPAPSLVGDATGNLAIVARDIRVSRIAYRVRPVSWWPLPGAWTLARMTCDVETRWSVPDPGPWLPVMSGTAQLTVVVGGVTAFSGAVPAVTVCDLHVAVDDLAGFDAASLLPAAALDRVAQRDLLVANVFLGQLMAWLYVLETVLLVLVALVVAAVRAVWRLGRCR
jgi:hypothetical protein